MSYEVVRAGGVPAEWFRPDGCDESRVILYLHGGGYSLGSIDSHRDAVSRLCRAAGARGLVIDYRLAPEHPFPAQLEDALAAYRWLLASGVDPARVVVAGESAGAGLTLSLLLSLREARAPMPAAAVCASPWTDLEMRGALDERATRATTTSAARSSPSTRSASSSRATSATRSPTRITPTSGACRLSSCSPAAPRSCSTTRATSRRALAAPGST